MDSPIGMLEHALAIHLAISKVAIILVTLYPGEHTLTVHDTLAESSLVVASICIDSISLAMF